MKSQILHLFKNDVRHLWREIVLMAVLVIAYGWRESSQSREAAVFGSGASFPISGAMLSFLVPLSFILLILRAVYAECLVGDRQFWVTRPYDWRQLLAEKILFVLAFVNLPLFILQAFLMWHIGFPPARYYSGLLNLQWPWVLFVFLPTLTLAVVTASIGQFVLTVLGALVYLIAIAALVSKVPNIGVDGANGIPFSITTYGAYAAVILVVLWQYARRSTVRSRGVLVGLAAAIPILFAVTPYRAVIAHIYPPTVQGAAPPVQLAFDPAKPASLKGGYYEEDMVHIRLPLLVSGLAEGSVVTVSGTLLRIEAPGGPQWDSGWQGQGEDLLASRPHTSEVFALPREFFEQVKSNPVNARLTIALTPARAMEVDHIVAGPGPFTFPAGGRCSYSPFARNQAACIFPPLVTQRTQRMLLSARSEEITCKTAENAKPLQAGTVVYGWLWRAGFSGLDPVSSSSLELSDIGESELRNSRGGLCPGTALTVYTGWQDGPRYQADLVINGIHLSDYKLEDSRGDGGFGVSAP